MRLYIFSLVLLSFLSHANGTGREGNNQDPFEKNKVRFRMKW